MYSFYLILFWLIRINCELPSCTPRDYHYSYTDCDKYNGRWRVSVPKELNKCIPNHSGQPPKRVDTCFPSCEAGYYFDSAEYKCIPCRPGYYSLGGGVRFTSFNESNFSESGFTIKTLKNTNSCGWRIHNGYLENKLELPVSTCSSILSYSVEILKLPAQINFTYQFLPPEDSNLIVFFTFLHVNMEQKSTDYSSWRDKNIKELLMTQDKKWRKFTYEIKRRGHYSFIWRTYFFSNVHSDSKDKMYQKREANVNHVLDKHPILNNEFGTIRIKTIEVSGVSYASECTPCEPGTFSNTEKSAKCTLCPKNTNNPSTGVTSCSKCDTSYQFSFVGSKKCLLRPECNEYDYYEFLSDCVNGKRNRTYKWIEPKICQENKVKLPDPQVEECNLSEKQTIQKCSPGMELRNNTCYTCPEKYYSNETQKECTPCPPNNSPIYSLIINSWYYRTLTKGPIYLSWHCLPNESSSYDCENDPDAWSFVPATQSYVRSSTSAVIDSILVLSLTIPGFRHAKGGKIRFSFELFCEEESDCVFALLALHDLSYDQGSTINQWDGGIKGVQKFEHNVAENVSFSLKWVFMRRSLQSHVRIYEIIVTNVLGSGAIECKICPLIDKFDCAPCPPGHFINASELHSMDSDKPQCVKCPQNTMINSTLDFPIGEENSCIPCGPGLISSEDRSTCYNDCNLTLDGETYDLSQLKTPLIKKSDRLFFPEGEEYYHIFNISLCGAEKVTCVNNISNSLLGLNQNDMLESLLCRATIVPSRNISAQSISLGDQLLSVTRETTYRNISVHPEFNGTKSDIHFYYFTKISTPACANGRSSIISLRCDPNLDTESQITTPKSCPYGTCDGCNYHFMIKTPSLAACKHCTERDYDTVVSECIDGKQQIHLINPRGCIISPDNKKVILERACSSIPKQVKMGTSFVIGIGIILLALVFHFWNVNRKLEYKYSKLIENKQTAECCMDYEDDDEIRVRVRKEKDAHGDYETIQLTKQTEDDVI